MPTRRLFAAGAASAFVGWPASSSWAQAGGARYLSSAKVGGDEHKLIGLGERGDIHFETPIPGRGHAAAAHPLKAEAVAFARRPGRFALVVDCANGRLRRKLTPPNGRHFYGHGAYSADGSLLLTSENDIASGTGRIGVWSVDDGYRRVQDATSGGIGPHDVVRLPGGGFAVANGGVRTHPDSGRAKLNIPTMRPNLAYLDSRLNLIDVIEPDRELHKNSIRHLAVSPDGTVALAMQWQGDVYDAPPLLALHRRGGPLRRLERKPGLWRRMQGYAGSVAFNGAGDQVAVTSPRGGRILGFDTAGEFLFEHVLPDVCGVAATDRGFLASSGGGGVLRLDGADATRAAHHPVSWDNHIVLI